MPALPAVSEVLRVALIGTLGGDTNVVNRFYIDFAGGSGTNPGLATACTSIANSWNTNLAGLFPPDYTLAQVTAEDLTSSTSPVASATVSHPGTRSGNALAAGQAAVVRCHIGRRYRGGHPRQYLACFTNTDLANAQTWQPASMASLQSAFAAFMTGVCNAVNTWTSDTGAQQTNVSYYQGFTNRTYPSGRIYPVPNVRATPVTDLVTSYSVNPHVGSQRRRNQTP